MNLYNFYIECTKKKILLSQIEKKKNSEIMEFTGIKLNSQFSNIYYTWMVKYWDIESDIIKFQHIYVFNAQLLLLFYT